MTTQRQNHEKVDVTLLLDFSRIKSQVNENEKVVFCVLYVQKIPSHKKIT